MCQWDVEVFIPVRVLGVGDDTCPCDGGLGDADGNVRVTGDDFAVVVKSLVAGLMPGGAVISVGGRDILPGRGGFASVTESKATADMLGD